MGLLLVFIYEWILCVFVMFICQTVQHEEASAYAFCPDYHCTCEYQTEMYACIMGRAHHVEVCTTS